MFTIFVYYSLFYLLNLGRIKNIKQNDLKFLVVNLYVYGIK